jgi:hypothetical protein
MKNYIGLLVSDTGSYRTVKVIVHSLFEAENKLNEIAKKEEMIVEDIMEI